MKTIKYYLSLFLTGLWSLLLFLGIILTFISGEFLEIMYERRKLNEAITLETLPGVKRQFIIAGIIMLVIVALTYKPITKMRQKSRTARKFDKYGRTKDFDDYDSMSNKERKEFDRQRKAEMNRILPMTMVKQMTKAGSNNPKKDMQKLIGLDNVKETMEEMASRMEFEKSHKNKKMDTAQHMVFFGPPGTGKTTVAQIMTGFLYENDYIDENRLIEATGSFFTNGNAATKADALCEHAYGGVLFIDEAYAIVNSYEGEETIAAIIKQMEDHKDKFVLILAGYENEMKHLLASNPGFASRIKEYFYFEDYSDKELISIFNYMAKKEGFSLDKNAVYALLDVINEVKLGQNFGNARTMRNILDKTISKHILNYNKGISKKEFVIESQDIAYEKSFI